MFEGANSASQGFLWRRAVDAQDKASDATATAIALAQGIGGMRQRMSALEAEVDQLRQELALAQAGIEARKAVISTFKESHPQSPVLATVGRLKDGSPLSKGNAIFIRAFDETARKLGITDPEKHRIA